ncbi:MAG: PxKF domain-containing protein [Acidimicrobiales bacterium]
MDTQDDPDPTPTCSDGTNPVSSGDFFALGGPYTVTCSATDLGGLSDDDSITFTVVDTTDPTFDSTLTDMNVTATSSSGGVATWTDPTASDIVDSAVSVVCESAGGLGSGDTFPIGDTTVTCTATDDSTNDTSFTFVVRVRYAWEGFFQPIDNPTGEGSTLDEHWNRAKAGSAIPAKFKLGGDMGLSVFAAGYPRAVQIACPSSPEPTDPIEETVVTANSGLKYDSLAGQYIYVWKTPSNYALKCFRFEVKLIDGTTHTAYFQFTK